MTRSEAVCFGLISDDRKHHWQMFPFKTEVIASKRATNLCEARRKMGARGFPAEWRQALTSSLIGHDTCFKANNIVSPIGHRQTFPLKIVLVGRVVMVGKVELDSTFTIIQTVCCRSPQTPGTNISACLRRGEHLSAIVSQTDRRPLQII